MTDFISDWKKWGEIIGKGGVMEDNGEEQVKIYGGETMVTTAAVHI